MTKVKIEQLYIYKNSSMNFKAILIFFVLSTFNVLLAQEEKYKEIDYTLIAEGADSPIPDLQIVCFNRFFNKDYLPKEFNKKYNLTDKNLFKKKMLVEIFYADEERTGLDKIEIASIKESNESIQIHYDLINENEDNDDQKLAPFIVVQIPKSKKDIKFIKNGESLGEGKKLYVD